MPDASATAPPPLTTDTSVVAVKDQVSAQLDGETIILTMRDGVYYSVDRVGSRVWSLTASPITLGAVHRTLLDEYEVEADVAWRDLVSLVEDLLRTGLLVRAPAER